MKKFLVGLLALAISSQAWMPGISAQATEKTENLSVVQTAEEQESEAEDLVQDVRTIAAPAAALTSTWGGVTYYHNSSVVAGRDILMGVDISYHNGTIDFKKLANQVDFVIIRCGYGSNLVSQDDVKFETYVKGCRDYGIPYGIYLYSYATTESKAESEGRHALRLVQKCAEWGTQPSLPIYYDMEDKSQASCSASLKAKMAESFCDILEGAGYDTGIYANTTWFTKYLTDPYFDTKTKWVAQYNTSCKYTGDYHMWQCTSSASVSGISGRVDLNFLYFGEGEFEPVDPVPPVPETPETPETPSGNELPIVPNETPALKAPTLSQTDQTTDSVTVKWNSLSGAAGYEVYTCTSPDGEYGDPIATLDPNATQFTWSGLADGYTYFLKVRGIVRNTDGTVGYGEYSQPLAASTVMSDTMKIKTTRSAVIREYPGSSFAAVSTMPSGKAAYVLSRTVDKNGDVWYYVMYTDDIIVSPGFVPAANVTWYENKVSGVSQTANAAKTITLKWDPVNATEGYEVYRATAKNGTYKLLGKVKGAENCSFKDQKLLPCREYYYKVRAYRTYDGTKVYGAFSNIATMHTKVTTNIRVKTTTAVNLRSSAGTAYSALTTVPANKTFQVLYITRDKSGTNWYKIKYTVNKKSYTGYISSKYAKRV